MTGGRFFLTFSSIRVALRRVSREDTAMRRYFPLLFLLLLLCSFLSFAKEPVKPVKVEVKKVPDGWVLLRGGKPYYVYGVGGHGHLDLLKKLGGNSVRTWSADTLATTSIRADAQRLGLTIAAGLWLGHERHGFRYDDPAQVKKQFDDAIAAVEKFKNEPTILVWGIGNEMEGDGTNPAIWKAVNDIAREIHRRDPNHPTMTVIAGTGKDAVKLENFMKYCPDVDILGINSYGGMATLIDEVRAKKLDRPFIATEFGPIGWWERPRTSWGAPLEQTSTEKADTYEKSYQHSVKGAGRLALGSYAFVWGNKQERTHTWFGLLVPNAKGGVDRTAVVDVLSRAWTGKWPADRAPLTSPIRTDVDRKEVTPSSEWTATISAKDPDGDSLVYEWEVREETHDAKEGGDPEAVPPAHPEAIVKANGAAVSFRAPNQPGAYRLFVAVRDGRGGAATANVPFYVKAQ